MKKKILLVSLTSFATLVTSFAILAATRGEHLANSLTADKIHPGTIVIDVNDENVNPNENTYNYVKSEAGNNFEFEFNGVSKEDGVFKIHPGGTLGNVNIINGITELKFVTPDSEQELRIEYRLNGNFWEYDTTTFDVTSGGANYLFGDYYPGFFRLSSNTGEDFSFSRLTICYECTADTPEAEMYSFQNNAMIGGYRVYESNCLAATTGSSISSITLSDCNVILKYAQGKEIHRYIDSKDVSNLVISYNDEVSNVVLEGVHDASISFNHYGIHYYMDSISLIGYDHFDFVASHVDVGGINYFRYQVDNNTIPDDFMLSAQGDIHLYNSSNEEFYNLNAWLSNIPFTLDMVVSCDEDRFTGVGEHEMLVNFQGMNYACSYTIYNPEVNNIRYISLRENSVMSGITLEEFLDFATSSPVYIDYYEYDPEAPDEVYLTSENFDLTEGMFDNAGEVKVPIHYSTFNGFIYIYVQQGKGALIKTYTNEVGVNSMGYEMHEIALYDNDVCEINPSEAYHSQPYAYEKDGSILIIYTVSGYPYKFTVDDENNTFERYVRTEGLVHTYTLDLSNIAVDASGLAYIYNDGTIGLDIDEEFAEGVFTVDPENENVLYLSYEGYNYVGTIDPETDIMVVDFAKQDIDQEGLIKQLIVDFSALGAPRLFDGYLYDDGRLIIDVGTLMECQYTVNPDNNNIIYFLFADHMQCVGTIDPDTNVMVVTYYYAE